MEKIVFEFGTEDAEVSNKSFKIRKKVNWSREMAQLEKCLPSRQEGLASILSTHMVAFT